MNIRDRRELKARARIAFAESAYDPRKLALIYTGAAVALSLVLTVLNYILSEQIGGTGGLSGMGLRSVLSTAQTMLSIISMTVAPFWELGFLFGVLKIARGEKAEPGDLLRGFRRFGPALRLMLLQGLLYMAIAILCINIGSGIYILTPFSQDLAQLILTADGDLAATQTLLTENIQVLVPLYAICLILLAVIAIPVFYRFRLAAYLIVDDPKIGAMAALGTSHRLMRYNRWAMFRLDLSYWWYYGLQLLCTALVYGDVLLAAVGISLPVSPEVAYFGACIVSYAAQLLLGWFYVSPVAVTYATAYETLKKMQKDAEPPLVKNFPWDFLPERNKDGDSNNGNWQ